MEGIVADESEDGVVEQDDVLIRVAIDDVALAVDLEG